MSVFRDRVDVLSVAAASVAVTSLYPTDAAVILSVEPESGRINVGARADLDGYGDEFPEAVRGMVSQMPDSGAGVVVVFGTLDQAQEVTAALAEDLFASVRVNLVVACTDDAVFVDESGEFVELSSGPLYETRQFAAFESTGMATRQTRGDLLRDHQPLKADASSPLAGPIIDADLLLGSTDLPSELLQEADALVARARQESGAVSEAYAALLGAMCLTTARRDALMVAIDREDAPDVAEVLRQVATRLAGPDAVHALAVCALAYWISGRGALAGVAIEAAEQTGGKSTLLPLVDELRSSPVMNPKEVWPGLQAKMRASIG